MENNTPRCILFPKGVYDTRASIYVQLFGLRKNIHGRDDARCKWRKRTMGNVVF